MKGMCTMYKYLLGRYKWKWDYVLFFALAERNIHVIYEEFSCMS